MKFKEFEAWCNQRACDGCWGVLEAMTCIDILNTINRKWFWKREKLCNACSAQGQHYMLLIKTS